MRIQGPAGTAMATPSANPARRASSGTFSVNEHSESSTTKGPSAVRTFGGIDALIALQGVDDPLERRRRQQALIPPGWRQRLYWSSLAPQE